MTYEAGSVVVITDKIHPDIYLRDGDVVRLKRFYIGYGNLGNYWHCEVVRSKLRLDKQKQFLVYETQMIPASLLLRALYG